MKQLLRKFRIVDIDVFIYRMTDFKVFSLTKISYDIQSEQYAHKTRFFIKDLDQLVHESYVYKRVYLLKSIGKIGPVIGDCFTSKAYRGQSIYPFVINSIAEKLLREDYQEVFVVVNQSNASSIKGIEKAGFCKFASIKATRWLWFYFKRQVIYYD
ncbi:hypothetical protein C1T31_13355 [Hanstruepera neustonica]|uniref:N-acetyltransferase domain-containing protein n=2 Tax=Hanstruepera neustonica TaxID=1445657 RepID=A0A2K1DVP3_9FLAO|nr:hypothetical protein C1T31_13355 [Hanstruepera neustonica]